MHCIYFGEPVGLTKCDQPAHHCELLDCHVVRGVGNRTVPGCSTCKKQLLPDDAKYAIDPLEIINRRRKRIDCLLRSLGQQAAAPRKAWEEGHGPGQHPWTPDQPSRGLGDTVAKVAHAIGIRPCGGCKKRQRFLNKIVPYR